jgi:hypothetical protein
VADRFSADPRSRDGGDWTGWDDTFDAFLRLGWPAVALAVAVIPLHRALRPTPAQPRRPVFMAGLVPAAALLVVALGYVFWLGPADIGKHIITYEQYMHG